MSLEPRTVGLIWSMYVDDNDGVNGMLLDWSVRRVDVKEVWTLTWNPLWNAHGPWTKAGGARPEDWPDWMRRFTDY